MYPKLLFTYFQASMQMIVSIILCQKVSIIVNRKLAFGNSEMISTLDYILAGSLTHEKKNHDF